MVIVVVKVLYQLSFELLQGVKLFQVKELALQKSEEVFDHSTYYLIDMFQKIRVKSKKVKSTSLI